MRISIITVVLNNSAMILNNIESVASQKYTHIEHIIIDGGSTDGTKEIIEKSLSENQKFISESDSGIYDAMNKGIRMATGDIIGILNSDDVYVDSTVIEQVAIGLKNNPEIESLYADLFYVDKHDINKIIRYWRTGKQKAFKWGWHPAHPAFFARRECYQKFGLFNLSFKLAADFELMLRFFEKYKITSVYLPVALVKMRRGGVTGNSISNILKQNMECYMAFRTNNLSVSVFYPVFRLLPKLRQYFDA